jgi:hypothetical protein
VSVRPLRVALLASLILVLTREVHAQRANETAATVTRRATLERNVSGSVRAGLPLHESPDRDTTGRERHSLALLNRLPEWSAPIASLAVPGIGQARLRQGRAAAYLAVECFLLLQYGKDLREGRRNEREYRDIARTIARRGFAASPPDTIWQYYEKVSEYVESGAFSMATSGPTVPETDPSTYNGYQWLLARREFCVDAAPGSGCTPQYDRALALYESRAMRQPYRWSWTNAQLERDLYKRTIARTNDAFRRATFDLSAVIANHLLSAIDAFVVVRMMQQPDGAMRFSASIPLR